MDVEDEIARSDRRFSSRRVRVSSSFFLFFSLSNKSRTAVPPQVNLVAFASPARRPPFILYTYMVHYGRSVAHSGLRATIRRDRYLSRFLKYRYICLSIVRQDNGCFASNASPSNDILWPFFISFIPSPPCPYPRLAEYRAWSLTFACRAPGWDYVRSNRVLFTTSGRIQTPRRRLRAIRANVRTWLCVYRSSTRV